MPLPAEDVIAIHTLLADYNHLVDVGDGAGFADLWVEDGTLDAVGVSVTTGRSDLAAFAESVPAMVPGTRHVISNLSVHGEGDEATSRCYLQMWATAGGAGSTSLVISGIYRDTLRKEHGRWRFVTRTMTPDA